MSIPEIVVNVEKRVCVKDELFIGKEISRLTKRVDGSICMHTVHNWIKMSFENHDTYVRRAKNEKEAEEIHIQYMIPVNKFRAEHECGNTPCGSGHTHNSQI